MKGSNLSARVKRVFRSLETDDIRADLILLKNGIEPHLDLSFFYLTGVESGLFEGSSLIAYPDGKTILYTSILEEESARKSGVRSVKTFRDEKEEVKLLKKEIGATAPIGINARELTYSDFLSLKKILRGRFINVSSA
ncbi:MAG: aminopeptidase P family N-terminal domain-containing protein, partial [Nitrososphaerales archaeon]